MVDVVRCIRTMIFGSYALVAKVMGVTFPKLTIVDAEWTSAASNSELTDLVHTKLLSRSTVCAVSCILFNTIDTDSS